MYYVYKTTNIVNNKIYIGVHSSENINDDQYFGSGKIIKQSILKYGKDKFKREILYQFETADEAYSMQKMIVDMQFLRRKDTYNIRHGGMGGLIGSVTVKDRDGNTFTVSKDDQRYISGELTGIMTNLIVVRDQQGNTFSVSKNDSRYLSGELVGVSKGLATVKDKNGNKFRVSITDPRYLSGQLVQCWRGCNHSLQSKAKIGNSIKLKLQNGMIHSQHGTMWITNGTQNKKVKLNDVIPHGWKRGRNNYRNKCWITDGFQNKMIDKDGIVPQGWKKGRATQTDLAGEQCYDDQVEAQTDCGLETESWLRD